jgi:pimeloyl-ACP methyl ester carboxylesterase
MSQHSAYRSTLRIDRDVTVPDGRHLAVQEGGALDGIPVFVHHGTPSSALLADAWLADASARGIRLVSWDRAGYGGSSRLAGRDVAAAAADAAIVADSLGIGDFLTWGHSGGGPHALACGALLPDRVRGVACLAGVAPYAGADFDWLEGMGQDNHEEFGAALAGEAELRRYLDAAREGLSTALAGDPEALVEAMASLLPDVDAAYMRANGAFMTSVMARGVSSGVDGWLDDDLAFTTPWGFELGALAVPVLLAQGDLDLMVPRAHGDVLAAQVAGAELRHLAGEGHLTLLGRVPDAHAWLLEAWAR